MATLLFFVGMYSYGQDVQGSWKGKLSVQGTEVPLIFNVSMEDGAYSSTMDSPSQGATDIPMDETTFADNKLTIVFKQAGIKYVGNLDGSVLNGTYYQGEMELPLVLEKTEKTIPGNPELPSSDEELEVLTSLDQGDYRYTVEDYFARPKASTFRFSPDGKYMSYREKDENSKRHIYVKDVATGETKRVIEEKEELVRGYGWINNERLVYIMDKGGDENYHVYAVNLDGSNQKDLTPFDGIRAQFSDLLKDDKDHIIVLMNKNNPQVFEPYKINVVNGEMEQLYSSDDPANPIAGYDFDKDGNLRSFTKLRDGVEQDIYYAKEPGKFELLKSLNWKDAFGILQFNYATDNPHDAYMVTNLENDKSEIVLYDLKEDKIIEKIFSNDQYDVSNLGISRNRNWELDYFSYEGERNVIVPVSDHFTKLHNKITAKFEGKQYSIPDSTDDESKYLIFVQSDRLYGVYYSYDAEKDEFTELYNLMPQLKEEDMAEMRPISFKSRDGLTIHGY
ncbi:MAG: S9 family peptidase, partial [Bacteroidota bacterium]